MNPIKLNSNLKTHIFLKPIQGVCFYIIALNLLWPYFADSSLSSLFSLACMALFGLTTITIFLNWNSSFKLSSSLCYIGLVLWSIVMIGAYGTIYSPHSITNFLGLRMDSYAIFFVRIFVSVIPCMAFVDYGEFTLTKLLKTIILLVLLVTTVLTSRAVAVNPDALRARASMEFEGLEFILVGAPGYSTTYSYSLLIPVFLHKCFTTTKKNKTYYVICIILLIYIVIIAQYATALIIAIVGALTYLIIVSKPKARLQVILFGALFLVLLNMTNGGSDIFYALADRVEGTWSTKLTDIALILEGQSDSGSISSRVDHYSESLNAFLKSPILGMYWNQTTSIGGHATAIDVLGLAGIMGFIPMMLSVYGNFARMKNHPSYQNSKPAVIACIVEFLVLIFSKNIVTSMAIFFVFYGLIPLFLKAEEGVADESAKKGNF